MPTLDGAADHLRLVLRKGEDFFYDIEFWDQPEDEGGVKVPLVNAWGKVEDKYDNTTLIDFADWITIVAGTVELRLEGDAIALLATNQRAVYQLFGRTDSDEDVILWHGDAQIKEDV